MSSSELTNNHDDRSAAPFDVLRQFARKREMRPADGAVRTMQCRDWGGSPPLAGTLQARVDLCVSSLLNPLR